MGFGIIKQGQQGEGGGHCEAIIGFKRKSFSFSELFWRKPTQGGFWCEIYTSYLLTYSTVQYSTVQYSTIQYSTVPIVALPPVPCSSQSAVLYCNIKFYKAFPNIGRITAAKLV